MEIAKFLNISQVTYGRYELGTSEPNIETMVKLADYFNVSLDYLCGRQYNNQVGYIPDDRKDLVKLMLKLDDTNASKLYGYANALFEVQKANNF